MEIPHERHIREFLPAEFPRSIAVIFTGKSSKLRKGLKQMRLVIFAQRHDGKVIRQRHFTAVINDVDFSGQPAAGRQADGADFHFHFSRTAD